jgi:hypothetical protein
MYTDFNNIFKNKKSPKPNLKKAFLIQKVQPGITKQFVRAKTNKFGPKVPKLQLKAAFSSPPQEQEEGARSTPYLLVV